MTVPSSTTLRNTRNASRRSAGDDPALRRQKRFTDAERTVGVMPFYAAGKAGHDGHADIDPMHGLGSGHTRYESKALYLNIRFAASDATSGPSRSVRWTRGIALTSRKVSDCRSLMTCCGWTICL